MDEAVRRAARRSQLSELQDRVTALEAQTAGLSLAQVMTRSFSGEIHYWSRGMERLYGFTAAEAVGQISHDLLRTEFPTSRGIQERELLERGEWSGELRHRRRDGQDVVLVSHQSLQRGGAGEATLVTEVNNDITEAWRGREMLQYLASIIESSEDAIVGKTLEGVVTAWNSASEAMFGYSAEEMIGQPVTRLLPPDRLHEEAMILDGLRRGERLRHFETVRRRKDGSEFAAALTISPIRGPSGEIIGASKIVRDITAERQSQSHIQRLQAELAHVARLTTMGQMASAIAHELNQPLTAVSNNVGALNRLLTTANLQPDRVRDIVDRIRQQTTRAGEVIRRLRAHVGKRSTTRRREDVNSVVREAVELAVVGTQQRSVHTSVELDPRVGSALLDNIQIGQVIINLVRNAIEAMEASETRELTVATRTVPGAVEISVADTGPGIAPEVAERLFQPFVTSKAAGLGLGLSICRELVEAHGGRLSASSRTTGGTVFVITLPTTPDC